MNKYLLFNRSVQSLIDYLKAQYAEYVQDFQVFEAYFNMCSFSTQFPLNNFRELTKPVLKEILTRNEKFFLEYSTVGLFESANLKTVYLNSTDEQKKTLWTRMINLVHLAYSVGGEAAENLNSSCY